MSDSAKPLTAWMPATDPIEIAILNKLQEELHELGIAVSRCLGQGIDEINPSTGKPNRLNLEEELADVSATAAIVTEFYELSSNFMADRSYQKIDFHHKRLDLMRKQLAAVKTP